MSGYSKNLITLERMLPFLGPVIDGELCSWSVPPGEADRFAYKVREAFYVAKVNEHRIRATAKSVRAHEEEGLMESELRFLTYEKIVDMAERFRVVVVSPRLVQTQLAKGTTEAEVLTSSAAPTSGYEDAGRSFVAVDRQTYVTVKETWLSAQPSNSPFYFPNANLSYDELVDLYKWATDLKLLMFVADGALTLQRRSSDLVGFAWHPRDAEPEESLIDFPFKDS